MEKKYYDKDFKEIQGSIQLREVIYCIDLEKKEAEILNYTVGVGNGGEVETSITLSFEQIRGLSDKTYPSCAEYKKKFIQAVKECKTDEQLGNVINKIYEDGFADGHEEGVNEEDKESFGAEPLRDESMD